MTSSNSNFQNPRKTYKVYILEIIRAKFHQNRFSRLGCSADTHRQTDTHTHIHTHTHTHAHTHTLGSIATYSVKMTEYKKTHGCAKILRWCGVQKRKKKRGCTKWPNGAPNAPQRTIWEITDWEQTV